MYAIRYFRDADVVRWYERHGITHRPVAYVVGMSRFETQMSAQREANHMNSRGPSVPVEVIRVSS
jgi:hypothetical protein